MAKSPAPDPAFDPIRMMRDEAEVVPFGPTGGGPGGPGGGAPGAHGRLEITPDDYHGMARLFGKHHSWGPWLTILRWRQDWLIWEPTKAYRPLTEEDLDGLVYAWTDGATTRNKKGELEDFRCNEGWVGRLLHAYRKVARLDPDVEPNSWLPAPNLMEAARLKDMPPADRIFCNAAGLLDIETGRQYEHDPAYFTLYASPVAFDPAASCPIWRRMQDDNWRDDEETKSAAKEIAGLLIFGFDGSKDIPYLYGTYDTGKSLYLNTLRKIIGPAACFAPSLSDLTGTFTLEAAISARIMQFSDVEQSRISDGGAEGGRLKQISGRDPVTIHRKFKPSWTGILRCNIVMTSNSLLRFPDSSDAIGRRICFLPFQRRFIDDAADKTLPAQLDAELQGILRWALEGHATLRARGYLKRPRSGDQATAAFRELTSPIVTFLSECCDLGQGADHWIDTKDLHRAYNAWRVDGERGKVASHVFGRELMGAGVGIEKHRPTDAATGRRWIYRGVRLRADAQDLLAPRTGNGGLAV